MPKIAIFASGEGSNASVIIDYFNRKLSPIKVVLLLCNRKEAGALEIAKSKSVPCYYRSNEEIVEADSVLALLKKHQVDWIVLAGFLRKIPEKMLAEYPNRIFNIHPSLLPKFGGQGMYGKKVHEAVLKAEEKKSGISIHLVNEEYDKGEILKQGKCLVQQGETVESLEKKIRKLEHELFPLVIEEVILNRQLKNED